MKLSITLLLSLLIGLSASAQTIEERVEELEIARTLNIFKFSGDLTLFYDGIELENGTSSEVDDTTYSTRLWAGINFNANPYDDVKFYGRLAVSKFFNEAFGSEERVADTSASRSQAGPQVYLEKAYFDYSVLDSLIISAGRLPTSDGVPTNYITGQARMGTYPRLAYGALLDGVGLTYKLGSLFGEDLSFRTIYTPFNAPTFQSDIINKETTGNDDSHSDTYAVHLDWNKRDTSIARNINVFVQYLKVSDLNVPDQFVGAGNTVAVLDSDLALNLTYLTYHLELEDIANSGVNLAFSYLQTKTANKGTGIDLTNIGTSASVGFNVNDPNGEVDGDGFLVSASWRVGSSGVILGAEYLSSDDDYGYFDLYDWNLTNFYATRGTGTHVYATYQIKPTFTLTAGYRSQDYSAYTTGLGGADTDTDREVTTMYLMNSLTF
ncbi:MAG: hypothetical protein CL675_06520 [Bdellovibrionaceae bacterium]|nr:hypothetical protein [Pseudobdellovibrionaceae bacterium]